MNKMLLPQPACRQAPSSSHRDLSVMLQESPWPGKGRRPESKSPGEEAGEEGENQQRYPPWN